MSKFINGLNENRIQDLSKDKVIDILKKECKQSLQKGQDKVMIYRATDHSVDFINLKPTGDRKSAFTSNYYTLIMNNHPDGKSFPKREIICSGGGGERAYSHGASSVYGVFPYDNAKIGICPVNDIGRSFEELKDKSIHNMRQFNDLIGFSGYRIPDDNGSKFVKMSKNITVNDIVKDELWFMNMDSIYKDLEMSLYEFITEYMNPYKNNFQVKNIKQYDIGGNNDLEVWTDSPCILVNINDLNKDLLENI